MKGEPSDPVTRGEFDTFSEHISGAIDKLSKNIEGIVQARQINLSSILAIIALAGGAFGFAIKSFSDVSSLATVAATNRQAAEEFRERIRALETAVRGMTVENETQHGWMADVINLEAQHTDRMMRTFHPSLPERTYWPLDHIGQAAHLANGKQ